MSDAMQAETIRIAGHGGDEIEAYVARPSAESRRGSVVVIHHMPGYDAATKEIARRFAALGYNAICPNLHYREAPGASPDDASAATRAAGGVPDDRLVGDVGAAAEYVRALPTSNGKVGVIGYCSGGRQTVLAACSLAFDAAVDCYGAFVIGSPPAGSALNMPPVQDKLPNLSCPLLGLFGAEDTHPSPAETAQLEELLKQYGKTYEFHTYENAGHGFFATDRQSYRVEAAVEGWDEIADFFKQRLEA